MNGGGSCAFQVWMRVVWVGTACAWLYISAFYYTTGWMKTCYRLCFPSGLLWWIEDFQKLNSQGFVPFFLSSSHPCSALESPPSIDDLFHMLPVIIAVTGAAIPLFRNKDFEMENCRRQRTLRRKEKVNVAISITIETLFIRKAGCPNQFDGIYSIQNQSPQCKLNLQ